MASIIPGFEYDIFISYRHKDNKGDHWVTEFVNALKTELDSTFKEDISIYFDTNPQDGLLETHNVDKSLEGKLKCLIFIPIISQTYCDPKSFAWQHEFCAFNKLAKEDPLGRDIKLHNGNVASRILPIKIHGLEVDDKNLLEKELGGGLRGLDFIYKEAGVNRPLKVSDRKNDNLNKTDYENQVNKVANAIKDIFHAIKGPRSTSPLTRHEPPDPSSNQKKIWAYLALAVLLLGLVSFFVYPKFIPVEHDDLSNSIAVLYFDNISSDPEQDYFSDGITEEITARLSMIKGLRVTSRTSVIPFKGKSKAVNIRDIAAQLNVTSVLEGSVRKSGDKLRITAQLIDARTDQHIWTEVYDRNLTDVFKIQSEIALAIADKFKVVISKEANERIVSVPTTNIEAYELYLKARSTPWGSGAGIGSYYGGWDKAKGWLLKAIALDPEFSQPYALLSDIYFIIPDSADYFAKEAIIRNPKSVDGYIALARTHSYKNGLQWLRKACAIDSTQGLQGMGDLFNYQRKLATAIKCYSQAIKLSPYWADPYIGKADVYNKLSQKDSVNRYLAMAEKLAPGAKQIYRIRLLQTQHTGDIEGTKVNCRKYFEDDTLNINKDIGIACIMAKDWKQAYGYYYKTHYRDMDWGLVLIKLGRKEEGLRTLRESLAFRGKSGWAGDLSRINILLGNKAEGIQHFKRLIDLGGITLDFVRHDPYWDEVRQDPEFKKSVDVLEKRNQDELRQIKEDENKKFRLDI